MKRNISLIVISILLIIPNIVLADVGMPEYKEYEAYITNPNGAICYTWNEEATEEVLPYSEDETYYVLYEYKIHNKNFALMSKDKENWDSECYVNEDDIKPVDFKFDSSDYHEVNQKYYVWESGVTLKKGPGYGYKNVTNEEIPVGTILTVKYMADDIWGYVIYQGNAGWVDVYQEIATEEDHSSLAMVASEKTKILTYKEKLDIYDKPVGGSIIASAPENTVLTYQYYYNVVHSNIFYVTYNGKSGWTHEYGNALGEIYHECDYSLYVTDSSKFKIYTSQKFTELSKQTLEDDKIYKIAYYTYNEYGQDVELDSVYVIENGTDRLFIKQYNDSTDENRGYLIGEKTYYYKANEDLYLYDTYKDNKKVIDTIEKDTIFASKFQYYTDNNYNNKLVYIPEYGWVQVYKYKIPIADTLSDEDVAGEKNILGLDEKNKVTTTTTAAKEKSTTTTTSSSQLSFKELLMIIISCVVVLALTIVVVIVLINKKRKQKALKQVHSIEQPVQQQVTNMNQPITNENVIGETNITNGSDNNVSN